MRAVLALASTLALASPVAFAKDQKPGAVVGPNGSAWGQQCFSDSGGQGSLGDACCANFYASCLGRCDAAKCGVAIEACLGERDVCYQACQRAYNLCLSLQATPEPPAGRSPLTPRPRREQSGDVDSRTPAGRHPEESQR